MEFITGQQLSKTLGISFSATSFLVRPSFTKCLHAVLRKLSKEGWQLPHGLSVHSEHPVNLMWASAPCLHRSVKCSQCRPWAGTAQGGLRSHPQVLMTESPFPSPRFLTLTHFTRAKPDSISPPHFSWKIRKHLVSLHSDCSSFRNRSETSSSWSNLSVLSISTPSIALYYDHLCVCLPHESVWSCE